MPNSGITFRAEQELRVVVRFEEGRVTGYLVESRDLCLLGPDEVVKVAFDRILEVSVAKEMLFLDKRKSISLGVALWEGGLPMDLLPGEGMLEIQLGEENFAWKRGCSPTSGIVLGNLSRQRNAIAPR